jgi:hypothetical protein
MDCSALPVCHSAACCTCTSTCAVAARTVNTRLKLFNSQQLVHFPAFKDNFGLPARPNRRTVRPSCHHQPLPTLPRRPAIPLRAFAKANRGAPSAILLLGDLLVRAHRLHACVAMQSYKYINVSIRWSIDRLTFICMDFVDASCYVAVHTAFHTCTKMCVSVLCYVAVLCGCAVCGCAMLLCNNVGGAYVGVVALAVPIRPFKARLRQSKENVVCPAVHLR